VEIKMVLYLPRDAASVSVSRQVLDGCLETLGVTPDTRADIALALSEACANVILHAGPVDEYEVMACTRKGTCVIEVVNTGPKDSEPGLPVLAGSGGGANGGVNGGVNGDAQAGVALAGDPVPPTAEHGRGLKIIDAVMDTLLLTGNEGHGTTVHFEKALDWVPGAAGEQLFSANGHGNQ
jgi:serine/threonine-protein kinase RsbW